MQGNPFKDQIIQVGEMNVVRPVLRTQMMDRRINCDSEWENVNNAFQFNGQNHSISV